MLISLVLKYLLNIDVFLLVLYRTKIYGKRGYFGIPSIDRTHTTE